MRKLLLAGAAAGLAAGAGYQFVIRPWYREWGIAPDEQTTPLPGDELLPGAETLDTRGISIAAPPPAVWPWLVQMGFGRAGWYSYDALDMIGRSATEILPGFQQLTVGDIVPTGPGTGFEVALLEPGRALVLRVDDALVRRQIEAAHERPAEAAPAGVAVSGGFLACATPPEFALTWAFVLEPEGADGTRLVERVRGRFGPHTPITHLAGPALGFAVFVMTQRQMLGIKERAERTPAPAQPTPGPAEPTAPEPEAVSA